MNPAIEAEDHARMSGRDRPATVCFPHSVAVLPAVADLQAAVTREAIRVAREEMGL